MITFLVSIALLILGYVLYGRFVAGFWGVDEKLATPAVRMEDGVDYKVIPTWKVFIIQFLNIAGLGPIFGAILGAAYGYMAYVWIVFGCIFMGAVHDFCSGMLSIRNDGANVPAIIGKYLGKNAAILINIVCAALLFAVGATFTNGPAGLLSSLTGWNQFCWVLIIFAYYLIATLLPINKIIGRIYPFFGAFLLFMALGVAVVMVVKGMTGELHIPELSFAAMRNMHADSDTNILFPMLFVVISCGALSGFHSTQSPLMARCISNEKYCRPIFYGAMICEGIVAIIWATAAIAYCGGVEGLNAAASAGKTPAILVNEICNSWLGKFGAVIAVLGVIVCPVSTGDTALRSLRITLADAFRFSQKSIVNRLIVTIPIFAIVFNLCLYDFAKVWCYVGITNQILSSVMLWTISAYLKKNGKKHWITSVSATFMTFVCVSYLIMAPFNAGGFGLNQKLAYVSGAVVSAMFLVLFLRRKK
ncbi:MAG: carbon starvation protein A [Bacteroidaceae bacterium]|nr:carbon starvation protein A [Bacteroidaceae bacterium]